MKRILLLLTVMALALCLSAGVALAEPRIKVSGCEVNATNRYDPIAFAEHLHNQFGNPTLTNESTGDSLKSANQTTCNESYFTTAGWFPVERYEPVTRVTVYYRALGDQTGVQAIPTGLQLLGTEQHYNCNAGSFQDTPPYGCKGNWATRVVFPDCWSQTSMEETETVYSDNGVCPVTHAYRIPQISYLIQHDNADRKVPNPLTVSSGIDTWATWDNMHGDYFAANQDVFNNELIDLCLRNAPDSVTVADPRCGEGP